MANMTFFPGCENASVGVQSIQCINAEAGFVLGWMIVLMISLVLFRKVDLEPVKDRIAVISFVMSILSMLLIASGFLPENVFVYFLVASVGSIAALMYRG